MRPRELAGAWLVALATTLALLSGGVAHAAEADSPLVEIPVGDARVVAARGVTSVVVLDEAVCRIDVSPEGLRIVALARGESVVLVWQEPTRNSLLVRVIAPSPPSSRPHVTREAAQRAGNGEVGTTVQTAAGAGVERAYFLQHHFDWSQEAGGQHMSVRAIAFDSTAPGVPLNLNTVSLQYTTPRSAYRLADFSLSVNGGSDARLAGVSPFNAYALRGADAAFTRGKRRLELFGGTTMPVYFRSLEGTRAMAGLNLDGHPSPKLHLFATTAIIGQGSPAPVGATMNHGASPFQTAGVTYRFSDRMAAQATGGASTRGWYGDGAWVLASDRLSASIAGTASAPEFPLNQLQLLAGGTTSLRASAVWRATDRLVPSISYQHSATKASPILASFDGRSDYVNPSVGLRVSRNHSVTASGMYARNTVGRLGEQTKLRRLDVGWAAQMAGRLTNNIRVSGNVTGDAYEGRARVDTGVFENLNIRVGGGDVNLGFQRNRRDPSLAARLRQEIALLPVDAQQQFLTDPVGFVQSPNLSPQIATLLGELQASDTEFTVAGQFHAGQRLNLSLGYRFLLSSPTTSSTLRSSGLNYTLNYRVTSNWQLYSAVTDTINLSANNGDVTRTSVLLFGLSRSLHGSPSWLMRSVNERSLEGRVFVDRNIDGVPGDGDTGLKGIVVRLDTGQRATADVEGRFRFAGLKPRTYVVTMALDQFDSAVRVTTPAKVSIDMSAEPRGEVNFGVVNFSRLMGTVYNDYALDGKKRGDAPDLSNVGLFVRTRDGALVRRVTTEGSGEYRLDGLEPGAYELEIDPDTVPPNYVLPISPAAFELRAMRSLVVDVPLRALRSVSGQVVLSLPPAPGRPSDVAPAPTPLSGVVVVAGTRQAVTDERGYFILRDLPAGDIAVTLRAPAPLPAGMAAPSGQMRMPFEPTQIDNAVIVIRSADLAQRLQGQGR